MGEQRTRQAVPRCTCRGGQYESNCPKHGDDPPEQRTTNPSLFDAELAYLRTGQGPDPLKHERCEECGESFAGYGPDWCKTHALPGCSRRTDLQTYYPCNTEV